MYLSKKMKALFLTIALIVIPWVVFTPILITKIIPDIKKDKEIVEKEIIVNKEQKVDFNSTSVQNSNITNGRYSSFIQDESKNLWAMGQETKLQVLKLTKNGYESSWTDDNSLNGEPLLQGSNITNGRNGVIFEDDFGNIWTMAKNTTLQVLAKKADGTFADSWINDETQEGLMKGSNITDGRGGILFQDFSKNLWAMGNTTKLQVLKANPTKDGYVTTGWTDKNDPNDPNVEPLLQGSNIDNGQAGSIFEDDFGNLWSIGYGTKLQVLVKNQNGFASSWIDNETQEGLVKNSSISDGWESIIFQDQFKNLWVLSGGENQKLQVLRATSAKDGYVATGWTADNSSSSPGLLKGSNISNGQAGTIFQDKFKNLWTTGKGTKLQVLKANQSGTGYDENTGWIDDNNKITGDSLLKDSNINDGWGGVIFQDFYGNLWAMGTTYYIDIDDDDEDEQVPSKLQVLKINPIGDGYVATGWTDDNDENTGESLLKGSNINDGWEGTIFEDYNKNLWSIGYWSKLQVYDKNLKKWIS